MLLALVVGEQALRGRLPDEISGRGVRYADREELDKGAEGAVEAGGDIASRLGSIEVALGQIQRQVSS